MKRRTLHKIVAAMASFMLIGLAFTEGTAPAQADYIGTAPKANLSKYSPFIDWVDWSHNDASKGSQSLQIPSKKIKGVAGQLPGKEPYHVISERDLGNNSKLITRCTAKVVYSEDDASLAFHRSGDYEKDPFDDFYGSGHLVGIGRGQGGQSTIDVSCNVTLESNGKTTSVPIQGLVFADGESTNRRESTKTTKTTIGIPIQGGRRCRINGKVYNKRCDTKTETRVERDTREFFEITPHTQEGRTLDWKFLEFQPGVQCGNDRGFTEVRRGADNGDYRKPGGKFLYERSGLFADNRLQVEDNLRIRGLNAPCGERQPFVNVFAEGADGAYLDLNGAGGNYVAIGVVLGADFGDAPDAYGIAGAVVTPSINGGSIPKLVGRTVDTGDDLVGEKDVAHPKRDKTVIHEEDYASTIFEKHHATISYDSAPYLGAHGPDSDLTTVDSRSKNFTSDDTSDNGAEEDGIANNSLLVYAREGTNYELEVPCKAVLNKETFVQGWLDWNGDGQFTKGEAAYGSTVGQNAICPEVDGQKAKLHWNVAEGMLPTSTDPMTKSAIRLLATTDTNASFTGVAIDGEVEDHAVTLVRPQLTLNKQFVNGDGQPDNDNKTSLLTGWQFTANEANDYVLTGDGNIQNATTDASGNAILKFKQTSPSPEYLPLDARDATSYPGKDLTLTETPNYHYRLADFEAVNCTPAEKPADWSLMNNPDSYPWPEADVPTIKSSDGVLTVHNFSATSVATCQVNNKPDGVLKITPQVEFKDKTITPAPTIDTSLTFSGTWQCEAQVSGKTVTVDGTWGPVAAGTSWVFTPSQDNDYKRIPFGASCSVQQNSESTANDVKSQRPVKTGDDAKLYRWDTVSYAPTGSVSAGNSAITGSQDAEFVVTNQVVKKSKTSVSWKKTDELNRVLQGAEFKLTRTTAGFTPLTVTDCVAADATQCAAETDKDPVAGQFKVEDIPQGTGYQLTETKAPVGYKKLEDPTGFDVTQDDLLKDDGKVLADIINHPYPLNELPFLPITGGTATDIFLILGGVIGAMSLTLAIAAKRRNNQLRS